MTEINIEVRDEEVAREIAYGIIGRANDLYYQDIPEEEMAHQLKEAGQQLLGEYE